MTPRVLAGVAVFALAWVGLGAAPLRAADDALAGAVRDVAVFAQREVEAGQVSGVSVALVAGDRLWMEQGFGWADKRRRIPASGQTVYRVGSISKLFTALAAMQLAEEGRLDIDAPAARYVPEFDIVSSFPAAAPPTLRQLMCHRSGLVREAPVGGYFDFSEPGAAATVASLADCVLVHPPGAVTKYSNSGVTVVGRAVEEVGGVPFTRYQQERILGPLGMTNSGFEPDRRWKGRLARGYLPVAREDEGFSEIVAPHFEFGILPAGNLYSTVGDLARFLKCLFAGGRDAAGGVLVRPETLAEMWKVQMTGASNGFGLGFSLGTYRGMRTFGHMGAVYGFTSEVLGIPGQQVGVVVLANDDLAVGVVRRLARYGLDRLLAASSGMETLDSGAAVGTTPPESEIHACLGDYESESYWARVERGPGGSLRVTVSRQVLDLVPDGPWVYRGTGRLSDRAEFRFTREAEVGVTGFTALGQVFHRVAPDRVPDVPEAWREYLGSYGPRFIPLRVSVRHGHLYAMTENEYDYRLHPVNRTVFRMPPGLYEGEHLVFQRDRAGRVHGVLLANMPLRRLR